MPMELNQWKILVMCRRPQLSAAGPPPVTAYGQLLGAIRVGLMFGSRVNANKPERRRRLGTSSSRSKATFTGALLGCETSHDASP